MEDAIDISGLDEAAVIAALHNSTRALGMGMLHDIGRDITPEEVRADWDKQGEFGGGKMFGEGSRSFGYFHGRPLKVTLRDGMLLGVRLYDRDAGEGRCAEVIAELRSSVEGRNVANAAR